MVLVGKIPPFIEWTVKQDCNQTSIGSERIYKMSSWHNLAIPIVFLLTGLILVCGDSLGLLSLDRIQNFWPLAIVVVGVMELPSGKKERN